MGAVGNDRTTAAAIYAGATGLSWVAAAGIPALQAIANIKVLGKQKDFYDDIFSEQRRLVEIALARYCDCIENLIPLMKDAYDDVPQAAEYVPIDPSKVVGTAIRGNTENLPDAEEYAACVNRLHEQQAILRGIALDPRYVSSADLHSISVNDLLRGVLSRSDTMNVMTDVAESAALNGRIGGVAHLTRRSLGLSMHEAQRQGREAHRGWLTTLNQDVQPVQRQVNLVTLAQTPQDAIAVNLTQAQLVQNSLQNLFNQQSKKPPHRLAELGLRVDKCVNELSANMAKVSLTNTFVPNFAAAIQPAINAAGQALQGAANGFGQTANNPSTPQSDGTDPGEGGNYVRQNGANPFGITGHK